MTKTKETLEAAEDNPIAHELPGAGWPECYDTYGKVPEGQDGIHLCNAIHVFEGLGKDGQIYLRRDWAHSKWGIADDPAPDDFTPQDWGPMYTLDNPPYSLDELRDHLNWLVDIKALTPKERDQSEAFYLHLFPASPSSQ